MKESPLAPRAPIPVDAPPTRSEAERPSSAPLEPARCCLCGHDDGVPLAVGEDFERASSAETYLAVRCRTCGIAYLALRPALPESPPPVPPRAQSPGGPGRAGRRWSRWRRWREARRLLSCCWGLAPDARIVDLSDGDGYALELLREFGSPEWTLQGLGSAGEPGGDRRPALPPSRLEELGLRPASYDAALLLDLLDRVPDPAGWLRAARSLIKPGGRLILGTGNTETLDFRMFQTRHWGGYHFPRRPYLFDPRNLRALVRRCGLVTLRLGTTRAAAHWVLSLRNLLVDWKAAPWCLRWFARLSPLASGLFAGVDFVLQSFGPGARIEAVVARPLEESGHPGSA